METAGLEETSGRVDRDSWNSSTDRVSFCYSIVVSALTDGFRWENSLLSSLFDKCCATTFVLDLLGEGRYSICTAGVGGQHAEFDLRCALRGGCETDRTGMESLLQKNEFFVQKVLRDRAPLSLNNHEILNISSYGGDGSKVRLVTLAPKSGQLRTWRAMLGAP